ncbi:6-carboxyhexanoate--CoA ligase [Shouchella lonarensis]|uniref:6-carboxyhexanoate--CoA ligase n=1 Tax=Shouchella lonarensis TaxID=1464122 RepID=A0A1G6HVM7_9BACI|nr:6-carboxyhexanoate--CoA ligase [Shouchella lonarensis]SDB97526.1 6-carboxyhexanoate-CoA ligase [Shouchella lonarensis]
MHQNTYFNIRMRAAQGGAHELGGKHISGGEQLTTYDQIQQAVNALVEKGLSHSRGNPDFMQLQIEMVNRPVQQTPPLPLTTYDVVSVEAGQAFARARLHHIGIKKEVIEQAYEQAMAQPSMRGALIVDARTGKRLDLEKERGVRVSKMDWREANFSKWADAHDVPHNPRIKEALTLAAKVSHHPATIAEWCWSDDPDYVTGYVASKDSGYERITKLKEYGNEQGCRIFFIDGTYHVDDYMDYLKEQPILIQWEADDDKRFD